MNPQISRRRGTVHRRLDDTEATAAGPDMMADLRARIGDEAADHVQRSMVLHRPPRPRVTGTSGPICCGEVRQDGSPRVTSPLKPAVRHEDARKVPWSRGSDQREGPV